MRKIRQSLNSLKHSNLTIEQVSTILRLCYVYKQNVTDRPRHVSAFAYVPAYVPRQLVSPLFCPVWVWKVWSSSFWRCLEERLAG